MSSKARKRAVRKMKSRYGRDWQELDTRNADTETKTRPDRMTEALVMMSILGLGGRPRQ
jgi:hypothetical protein